MDTLSGMMQGMLNRDKEEMVFDWDKAAQTIRDRGATHAMAGLSEDWDWTAIEILDDGKAIERDPEDSLFWLASTWATPVLTIDGDIIECFKMESEVPGWDAKTYWPESALAILKQDTGAERSES